MKQFTRRTSQKAQLDVDKSIDECHDKAEGQPESKCTKVLKGAVAADPYSFDIDDDSAAQAKLATVHKLNESQVSRTGRRGLWLQCGKDTASLFGDSAFEVSQRYGLVC